MSKNINSNNSNNTKSNGIKKVIFDMDNTLFNLHEHMTDIYNRIYDERVDYREVEYDFTNLDKAKPNELHQKMFCQGFFASLKPMEYFEIFKLAVQLSNLTKTFEVYIATKPTYSAYCVGEKRESLQILCPEFDLEHIMFGSQKHLLADENTLIIEDFPEVLKEWNQTEAQSVIIDWKYNKDYQHEKTTRVHNKQELFEVLNDFLNLNMDVQKVVKDDNSNLVDDVDFKTAQQ